MKTQILDKACLEKVRQNSFCSILKFCSIHKVYQIDYGEVFLNYTKSVSFNGNIFWWNDGIICGKHFMKNCTCN